VQYALSGRNSTAFGIDRSPASIARHFHHFNQLRFLKGVQPDSGASYSYNEAVFRSETEVAGIFGGQPETAEPFASLHQLPHPLIVRQPVFQEDRLKM
jgi:hypothetical protein